MNVAACWTVTCTNSDGSCGYITTRADNENAISGYTGSGGVGIYQGEIGGIPYCTVTTEESGFDTGSVLLDWILGLLFGNNTTEIQHHPVSVVEGWTNHPNAS